MSAATLFSRPTAAPAARPSDDARDRLRVRLEEAALNATAVSAQLLHDGWLVRFAPSAAKRVRSINVLGLSHVRSMSGWRIVLRCTRAVACRCCSA